MMMSLRFLSESRRSASNLSNPLAIIVIVLLPTFLFAQRTISFERNIDWAPLYQDQLTIHQTKAPPPDFEFLAREVSYLVARGYVAGPSGLNDAMASLGVVSRKSLESHVVDNQKMSSSFDWTEVVFPGTEIWFYQVPLAQEQLDRIAAATNGRGIIMEHLARERAEHTDATDEFWGAALVMQARSASGDDMRVVFYLASLPGGKALFANPLSLNKMQVGRQTVDRVRSEIIQENAAVFETRLHALRSETERHVENQRNPMLLVLSFALACCAAAAPFLVRKRRT